MIDEYSDYTAEGVQLMKDMEWEKLKDESFLAGADTNFKHSLARVNTRS